MTPVKYKIDALRFKRGRVRKKTWAPPWPGARLGLLSTTFGDIRVLDTAEAKEPLLIIPDSPNLIEHYTELVNICRHDFRLVIFELPGLGFSFHRGNYDYSFAKTNQIILELLDQLGLTKVNIAFPCANGFYGLSFTREYPERVNHLFLVQTPSLEEMGQWTKRVVPSFLKTPYLGQVLMPWMEKKFATVWYRHALLPDSHQKADFTQKALQGLQEGASFCLCSLSQGLMSQFQADLRIDPQIPSTLMYSNTDKTHRKTDFSSIQKYNPHTELIDFQITGHFPDLEAPTSFLAVVQDVFKNT